MTDSVEEEIKKLREENEHIRDAFGFVIAQRDELREKIQTLEEVQGLREENRKIYFKRTGITNDTSGSGM